MKNTCPVILLLFMILTEVHAQDNTTAFSELDLGISIQNNINSNIFHEYWEPVPGLQVDFKTPFYLGSLSLNGRYNRFDNRPANLPYIDQLQISLFWLKQVPLLPRLNIGGGPGVGFSLFSFKDVGEEQRIRAEKQFGSTSPESEVGIGFRIDLVYHLSSSWSVCLLLSRNITYTSTQLKLDYVGFGVMRSFKMPQWMRRVLN